MNEVLRRWHSDFTPSLYKVSLFSSWKTPVKTVLGVHTLFFVGPGSLDSRIVNTSLPFSDSVSSRLRE